MSKQNTEKVEGGERAPQAPAESQVLISQEGLRELLAGMGQQHASSLDRLVEALIEARKPFIDPRQEENDRRIREQDRLSQARRLATIKRDQDNCPHLQGANPLSEFTGQLSSIVRHRLDDNEVVGICTNCIRIFRVTDPDYNEQVIMRKSGNRLSKAGDRFMQRAV